MFARPEFQWVEHRRALSWLANLWQSLIDWLNRLADQHPLGFDIGLGLVIVAVALLVVHIGYVVWRIVRPSARTESAAHGTGAVVVDAATHLARAAELARGGRYAEAMGHRFLAVVLEMDRLEVVRFHASKTPAEYVGEARLDDASRSSFAALVAQLYRHLFGAIPCDETEYRAFGAVAQELSRGQHVVPA
ncbi:MAG TPA: DUF4129 domain-containing protein [Gemmatimonadales bacterium]|nr:DUF4129 domain-containing protein [Gemmatimonadales bacterium]